MFDIFAKLLSSVASILFPLFASYKALKTSDPAQLTPWLMYWVVLACVLLVESWTEWFLVWIPFYAYIRLLFLLYLVLPQTQGARLIYEEYVHPRLEENETAIEEFIASAHERLRSAGIAYLKRAIELLKTNVLGLPPSQPEPAPEPQTAQSYTQALLARFTLPSPRWSAKTTAAPGTSTAQPSQGGGLTADFYNLLASAVSAAASATTSTPFDTKHASTPSSGPARAGSVLPETLRAATPAARMSFIQAQRERLRVVLSALDREEAEEVTRQRQQTQAQEPSLAPGSAAADIGGAKRRSSASEQSAASGLSKSRSEGDFEKLEAGSGAEEEMDLDEDDGPGEFGGG
ncbi:c945d759-008e-4e30-82d6-eab7f45118e1 [Thermothielavioides terrestris]|uniref:Protein YOP1 n=1 Tax=Thermothielavioides terrestris TaxID=2587410 RepID=A0A446BW53_9PEZI|nr:c945d759-008e-4e30-82d6-eab7f45118e1 [Thermothielavioides terrestris]